MTWAALFERAAECPATVAEVRERLARHREERTGGNRADGVGDGR